MIRPAARENVDNLYKQCEVVFKRFSAFVYDHKYSGLILILVLTIGLTSQLGKIHIDTRDEGFFHEDDPALVAYNDFKDQFGQDEIFIVAIQPTKGLDIASLQSLQQLHQELQESVPYLDEITSLVNGRVVQAIGDTLHVGELLEKLPKDDAQLKQTRELIDHFPLFENFLISKDKSTFSIILKAMAVKELPQDDLLSGFDDAPPQEPNSSETYLSNEESLEITKTIQDIVNKHSSPEMKVFFTGTPAVVAEMQMSIERDLSLIMPLSSLLIILFLTLHYRRISGVVYPLLIVGLSLLATFGTMALAGFPITLVSQILPSFLLIVGIGDTVHILTIFYRKFDGCGDKRQAIIDAAGFAGLPVLMTSVTTACGLFSFVWADVAAIAELGYIAPIGVLFAFVYTIVLLPVLIAIFPVKHKKTIRKASNKPLIDRLFTWIARITVRRPALVAGTFGLILVLSFYSALSVRFSHNISTWFPDTSPIRVATNVLDSVNGGSVMLEALIDTGRENGVQDPLFLTQLDETVSTVSNMVVSGIKAGKVWALPDVIKEIHRALHEDRQNEYRLPKTEKLIAQELLLFEASGSDDLQDFTDSSYRTGRLSILAPFEDAVLYAEYVEKLQGYLAEQFPNATVTLTGKIKLFVQIIANALTTMAKSYSFALVIITLLMIILIGRIRIGLMSMVANITPIVCILGIMGVLSIPLDLSTMLVGSLVLGIVVDDTIHFLHHFRRAFAEYHDVEQAVRETLLTTGRALFITTVVLCGGFFIYTIAYLANNVRYGIICGCAVILALVADFFLVPSLLAIVYRRKQ